MVTLAVDPSHIVAYVIIGVGLVFLTVGLILAVLTQIRVLHQADRAKLLDSIPVPGLGDLFKELLKSPWGLLAAVGLVLVIIGIGILGFAVNAV